MAAGDTGITVRGSGSRPDLREKAAKLVISISKPLNE
jgi:hypothetical protein